MAPVFVSPDSAKGLASIQQRFGVLPIVLVLGALLVWFSLPTFVSLHPFWMSDYDYSHGYLVFLLTVFLVGLEIRRGPVDTFTPSWVGALCSIFLAAVMLVGHAATTIVISQLALPALWICAIWAVAGARNARRFAPSLAYLYVAIPVWQFFTEPLRSLTIRIVSGWVRAAHMPAFIEGNYFHVPTGTFEVQAGCAGLHYALVSLALAIFVGVLYHRRFMLVALPALVGLGSVMVGNWLRVFITIAAGLNPEVQLLVLIRDHHTLYGWVMFVIFMLPFFYYSRWLDRRAANDAPVVSTHRSPAVFNVDRVMYATAAALVLGIALNYRIEAGNEALADSPVGLPDVPGWTRVADWQDGERPYFIGATATAEGWYAQGEDSVGVYGVSYAVQQQAHEIVFSKNRPEGRAASVEGRATASVTTESGIVLPFQELQTATDSRRRLVWIGLRVAGEPASSDLAAKALQLLGVLRGRRDAQALVLSAVCASDCSTARAALERYARAGAERFYERAEHF